MKFVIHYGIHLVLPIAISYFFFKDRWKQVYLIFLLSMLVDLDHLLATPIFDSNRCSIQFHPLHTYPAMAVYFLFLLSSKTRILGIALLLHMLADGIDCLL